MDKSGQPKPVVVSFRNSRKMTIYTNSFLKQNDSAKRGNDKRIVYINEHLTMVNKYLYKLARDMRKENKIKYVWIRNGKLFVRTEDNSPHKIINDIEQLNEFK